MDSNKGTGKQTNKKTKYEVKAKNNSERIKIGKRKHEMTVEDKDNFVG